MSDKKEKFKLIINEFYEKSGFQLKPRDLTVPLDSRKIIALYGPRRSGKTYYFYQLIRTLKEKIDPSRLLYINFEDDRLFPLTLTDLNDLTEAYFELFPENKKKKIYLFFDEIQNIEHWEKFVRRIYDKENARIFLTGSSSTLLSREIATALRGRTLGYPMLPLSFSEYLRFRGAEAGGKAAYSEKRFYVKKLFNSYLALGGFPEVALETGGLEKDILKNYYDLIVYKDLAERFSVRNTELLKMMLKYLLTNISSVFSVNAYFNSLGPAHKASRDTVLEYLGYLQEIELIFFVPLYSHSLKVQQVNPKKCFAADNGLRNAVAFKFSQDRGRLLENTIFVELKRRGREIFYYKTKNNLEVDFAVRREDNTEELIQVSASLDDAKTREREVKALAKAMDETGIRGGSIITMDEEDEIDLHGKIIGIVPAWKWLLGQSGR
jgi:uncharacterized protein